MSAAKCECEMWESGPKVFPLFNLATLFTIEGIV